MTEGARENRSNRTPMVLLPYQQRWCADLSPVKVMEKSRRVGLSWCEAADDTLLASQTNGMDIWYVGYNKDMALEFIGDCADWARFYELAAAEIEEIVIDDEGRPIQSFRIRFASGWKIVALSSRPANLRGKQGKIVIDEAAFHDDLAGLMKAAIAMLMWGGRVAIISTHNGDDNPFNGLINDIRAGRKPYKLHRVIIDEALEEGLYQRICLRKGDEWSEENEKVWLQALVEYYGDDADEELFCIPSQGSGVYLTRALLETCMHRDIPVIRYEQKTSFAEQADHLRYGEVKDWCEEFLAPHLEDMDPKRRSYFGEDFGRTGDLTVITPLMEQQDVTYRAPFQLELRNMPFKQQEQILYYIVDRLPRFSHGALDARGNGQYLAEVAMQKYGAGRISQVMLSESWYRENMPPLKAAFEDRTIALPLDADTLDDYRAFRMVKGVAKIPDKKNIGTDKKQRHGDSGIAGALAWFATRQEGGGLIEYEATGSRRDYTKMDSYTPTNLRGRSIAAMKRF